MAWISLEDSESSKWVRFKDRGWCVAPGSCGRQGACSFHYQDHRWPSFNLITCLKTSEPNFHLGLNHLMKFRNGPLLRAVNKSPSSLLKTKREEILCSSLVKKTDLLRSLDITTVLGNTCWSSVTEATPATCVGREGRRNISVSILYVYVERQEFS